MLMFGGSFDYAIEQLKNIVEAGSVTDGANGAIAFSKNETKNIKALNTSDIVDTTGAGDFYAVRTIGAMGCDAAAGVLRLSFVHYTTDAEVQQLMKGLDACL